MQKKKYIIIAHDFQTSVFPQYTIMHLWNTYYRKMLGITAHIGMINKKKTQEYFIPPDQWRVFQTFVQKKAEKNKTFVTSTVAHAMQSLDALNAFTEKNIFKQNLQQLSNTQLSRIYAQFFKLSVSCYGYGNIIFAIEFGEHGYFTTHIKHILQQRAPLHVEEYYTTLVNPSDKTIFYRQSLDILKVSTAIEKKKQLKQFFLSHSPAAIEKILQQKFPILLKEFRRQVTAYHWLFYNWEGPAMTLTDFILFAKDILKRGNAGDEYREKTNSLKKLKKQQQQLMQKLHFNTHERWLVKTAQLTAWFQPYRKGRQFKSCWHMTQYFQETARRLRISLDDARYLSHWEMDTALRNNHVDTKLINARKKMFIYTVEKNKAVCLAGPAAQAFYNRHITIESNITESSVLTGTCACSGQARGRVRIVNSLKEAEQFKRGDVLVSYATNTLLLPAMRMASAILTEEGGLTCHAAIVSRELQKPCIVGIKNLTASVKNGVVVTIDATKGIIKKL